MNVWQEKRGTGNPLTDAYLRGDAHALELYDYPSQGLETLELRAQELDRIYEPDRRAALVAGLRQYVKDLTGGSPGTDRLLEKLADPRCLVVVTGQQAGLFTGPLYTLYKALSAVACARSYEEALHRPVVPVFWIASEDHDFDEVASAWYVKESGELTRAHLRERPLTRTPVGAHAVSRAEFTRLMAELAVNLPAGLYKQDVLRDVEASYERTSNMGDFFAYLLTRWLPGMPILPLNPLCQQLRQPVRDAFSCVLQEPALFCEAAQQGARRVVAQGFTPQVELQPRHTLLYLIDGGKRSALDMIPGEPDVLQLRDSRVRIPCAELQTRLQTRPEDFSAGVLFRPVVQDHLLPVLTYVGGAAEIAYHGMMKSVFAAAGRKIPPLQLRQRVTVMPRRVSRALQRFEVELDDALKRDVLSERLARECAPSIDEVVMDLQKQILAVLHTRSEYFSAIDADLMSAVVRTEQAFKEDLSRLQGRAHRALRQNRSEIVEALTMVASWLRPNGVEQERLLSPLSVIAKYGLDWLSELSERPLPQWDDVLFLRW